MELLIALAVALGFIYRMSLKNVWVSESGFRTSYPMPGTKVLVIFSPEKFGQIMYPISIVGSIAAIIYLL